MATQPQPAKERFVKQSPSIRGVKEKFVKISPVIIQIVQQVRPDPRLPKSSHSLARKVALAELAEIKIPPRAPDEEIFTYQKRITDVLHRQVKAAALKSNLDFTPIEADAIVREIYPPLTSITELAQSPKVLPQAVKDKLETKALSPEKSVPASQRLQQLSPTGQSLKAAIQEKPEEHHTAARMASEGIFTEDIKTSKDSLIESFRQAGYSDQEIAQNPLIQSYQDLEAQLKQFQELHPKITKALRKIDEPLRRLGIDTDKIKALKEKFNLPHLELKKPAPIQIKQGPVRKLFVDFQKKYLAPAVKKVTTFITKSSVGQAVIAFANKTIVPIAKQVGQSLLKAGAAVAGKVAAKLGIKASVAAIGAVLPTGVTQVIAVATAVSAVFDILEAIPYVGPVIKKVRQLNPLKILINIIKFPFKLIKRGLQEAQAGEASGILKLIAGVGMLLLPVLLIASPVIATMVIGGVIVVGGAVFLVSRTAIFIPGTIARVAIIPGRLLFNFRRGLTVQRIINRRRRRRWQRMVIIITLILIALFILLFIFIVVMISGGAFMVTPHRLPAAGAGESRSRYLAVEKTVEPNSSSTTPVTATYTITISAGESNITVTNISDIFTVSPSGPAIPSSSLSTSLPLQLAINESQTFTYQLEFGPPYLDSVVGNQVIVTANVEDGPSGERASDSASVLIGNPPTLCFEFGPGWSEANRNLETQAIGHLSQWTNFVNLLCTGGGVTIFLEYRPGRQYGGYAPENPGNIIYIYDAGLGSRDNTIYTLAHESGHIIDYRNPGLRGNFREKGAIAQEGYLCSYGCPVCIFGESEDFAETIALYPVPSSMTFENHCDTRTVGMNCEPGKYCTIDYSPTGHYRIHYIFAQTQIYQ